MPDIIPCLRDQKQKGRRASEREREMLLIDYTTIWNGCHHNEGQIRATLVLAKWDSCFLIGSSILRTVSSYNNLQCFGALQKGYRFLQVEELVS